MPSRPDTPPPDQPAARYANEAGSAELERPGNSATRHAEPPSDLLADEPIDPANVAYGEASGGDEGAVGVVEAEARSSADAIREAGHGFNLAAEAERRISLQEQWVRSVVGSPILEEEILRAAAAAVAVIRPTSAELQAHLLASMPALAGAQRAVQDLMAPLVANVNASLGPLLTNFRGVHRWFLPPNLRSVWDQITPNQVRDFVREEGIPLYLVPRASIGLELLASPTHAARRTVLGRRFHLILDDCDVVLDNCRDPRWADQVVFLRDAIAAARAGHTPSAQALAASILDTLFTRWAPDDADRRRLKSRDLAGNPPREIAEDSVVLAYVMLPIWNAYTQYRPARGELVPRDFARHASAHSVGRRQYNRRNCVQSLMLSVSLLGYLQGQQPRQPRAAQSTPEDRRRRRLAPPG